MARPTGAVTEFRVLGPVEVVRDGQTVRLGGRRQRALLALLLLEPSRPVSSDRLIDELWSGDPPDGAESTLRVYVSRLRSSLGQGAISPRPPGYMLDIEPDRLDVHRFQQLLQEGRQALARNAAGLAADRLRAALDLWRGPALADVADWGALEREARRLDELRLTCIEERIEAELALGLHAELAPELDRLVSEEPLRERLWRQLVVALYRSERQADALAAYRRAQSLLADQLGLEPSRELRALERAVLRHEIVDASPAHERHNLPAPVTSFVGRDEELVELKSVLREHRLVTLTGAGGAGKTRLALEVATGEVAAWAGGVWLVDLAAVSDSALVPTAVARILRLPERPDVPVRENLLDQLREAELLLVLDNCEHLADACAGLVHELLRACPGVRVLATSRVALRVPGEADYVVAPLPTPALDAPANEAVDYASVRLFLDRGRAARRDLGRAADDVTTVARICRDVDGLPLAIELAAARAKVLSLDAIAANLDDRFRLLRSWHRFADPRHETLRATIDWSYELLADDERELLARLSVFAGGFTAEAVASVCQEDETWALALVGRLVESSLVLAEGGRGATRYRLLETIRAYATERLEASGMVDEFRRRHARHFLDRARHVRPAERRNPEALAVLDAEHGNVNEAVQWAVGSDAELAVSLVAELWPYWLVRGYRRQGLEWAAAALSGTARDASPTRAEALAGAALLARLSGDFDRARPLAEEGVALGRKSGAQRAVSTSLNVLITVEGQEGDYERARARCEESIAVARSMGSEQQEAFAVFLLAEAALHAGKYDDARDAGGTALELFRRIDDRDGLALTLARLGMTQAHEGLYEQALTYIVEALEYAQALGTAETGAWCCEALAVVAAGRGEAVPAARLLAAAEVFRRAVGGIVQPAEAAARDLALGAIRRTLGADELEVALESGRQLDLGHALAEAQRLAASAATVRSAAPRPM